MVAEIHDVCKRSFTQGNDGKVATEHVLVQMANSRLLWPPIGMSGFAMRTSSDPLLDLIHHLRKRTGITPIPLTEAEQRSGILAAFASAVAPAAPKPDSPKRYEWDHSREDTAIRAREQEAREEVMHAMAIHRERVARAQAAQEQAEREQAARAAVLREMAVLREQATKQAGRHKMDLPRPTASPKEATPVTRAAGCLAAYKKNQ